MKVSAGLTCAATAGPAISHRYQHDVAEPILQYSLTEKDPAYTLPFPSGTRCCVIPSSHRIPPLPCRSGSDNKFLNLMTRIHMKYIFFLAFIGSLLLAACKKDVAIGPPIEIKTGLRLLAGQCTERSE